jgi:hypothetical protein
MVATPAVIHHEISTVQEKNLISFEEAMEKLSREDRFRATPDL